MGPNSNAPTLTRDELLVALHIENARRGLILVPQTQRGAGDAARRALRDGDRRLAVYGTLAPGESNHHLLEPLRGHWYDGVTHGRLGRRDWRGHPGFPMMAWAPDGPDVAVKIFESHALPGFWAELDRFEGPGFVRIVVPVDTADDIVVANLYHALVS